MTDTPSEPSEPLFKTLTPEELENVKVLTDEEINDLLEEGRKAKEAARRVWARKIYPRF